MISKLRRKIICSQMWMAFALLALIFLALCAYNWHHSAHEVQSVMEQALQDPAFFSEVSSEHSGRGHRALLAVFLAETDANGQVLLLKARYFKLSAAEAQDAVKNALEKKHTQGTLWSQALRFQKVSTADGGYQIVFADLSNYFSRFAKLVGSMLIAFTLAMFGLLGISVLMARQAVRPVELAWQSQRRFVADASHELKTPLAVILANGGILARHRDSTVESQMQWVNNTLEEARRMQKLVDDMLFLARSDDGGFSLQKKVLSLSDLAWQVELPFEAVAYEQGVMLDCSIEDGLQVFGDEAQLQRLLIILLDNACKYAGENGSAMFSLSRQRNHALLCVQNTGPAIPPEQLARIFERFYRADPSRSRTQGGYGLGLSIAESIVHAHGGSIRAESSPDTGTVFTVLLDLL